MGKKRIALAVVVLVALFGVGRSSAMTQLAASAPSVTSERDVYSPGDTVTLSGAGWEAAEAVHLFVNDNVGNTWNWSSDVTADGDGAFTASFSLPSSFVATYSVTATGGISGTATTTFFDDNTVISGPTTANVGDTKSYSASKSGNGCTTTSGTWSVTPAGTSILSQSQTDASIKFNAAGTYTVTSTWTGTNNGGNPCTATGTLTVSVATAQQATSISAVSGSGTYGGTASLTATLKSGTTPVSGKTISFTLNGSSVGSASTDGAGVATLGGVSLGSISAGTLNNAVGASFAGDSSFTGSSGSGNLSVAQAASTTTVACPAGAGPYDGLAKTPCSASVTGIGGFNQTLTVGYFNNVGAGIATASASYAGDANHSGSSDSKTFAIGKASSATTLTCPARVTYDGSAQTPCSAAVTGAGGLSQSVTVSYSSNVGAGTASASATFGGDANHDGSSDSKTFTIGKADQTITFDDAPFSAAYDSSFEVHPTASSGLAVALGGTPGICSVGPDPVQVGVFDVTMLAGTGTCHLNVSQPGDSNYNSAPDVTRDVAAAKASQTITFDPLADKVFGDADFGVSASASSGLPVAFAAGGDCSLSGASVHITGAGSCTITASQGGNGNYDAAADVERPFVVAKAPSTVSVTCDPGPFTYTGSAYASCSASVTGVGGLDSSLTVSYGDNVNAGTVTASASYHGDDNHTGSSDSASFEIAKAPSSVTVDCPTSRVYIGSAIEPCTATATGAGGLNETLLANYSSNVDAGTASVSASYDGDGNHTGSSGTGSFTIEKAPSTVTVTCPGGPFVYAGLAHTPCSAAVTGAGGLDAPLPVSYVDNVDAGTATASASYGGDANHLSDDGSSTFTIDKATSHVTVTCDTGPFTYNGSAYTPCSAGVTGAGGLDQSLPVGYSDNTAAGTATASAGYNGDANHTGDSGSTTFTIDKAASDVSVTCPDSRPYTGNPIEPCAAKVTGAGGLDSALGVSYSSNVDTGTATASAVYAGDANHFGDSASTTFTITKAPSTVTVTCGPGPFTFNGSAQTPCSANATGAGGLDTTLPVTYADNVNAGTATASATYAGDSNHTGNDDSKTFTVGKATPTVSVTWNSWTYDGTAHPAAGSVSGVGGASLGSPSFTYYSGATTSGSPLPGAPAGVGTFTVLGSFAGNPNYTAASKTKTVGVTYRWDGFLQPINDTAHQGLFESSFKLGSTIPAKFQLKKADGSVIQAGALPVFSRSANPVSCDTQITTETPDTDTASAGTTFRWDTSAQQYIYNWSTKGLKAGEYRIYAALDDGSKQFVDICLK